MWGSHVTTRTPTPSPLSSPRLPASLSWGEGCGGRGLCDLTGASRESGQRPRVGGALSFQGAFLTGHLWPILHRHLWTLAALDPQDCQVRGPGASGRAGQLLRPQLRAGLVGRPSRGSWMIWDRKPQLTTARLLAPGSPLHSLPGGPAVDRRGHRAATRWLSTVQLQLLMPAPPGRGDVASGSRGCGPWAVTTRHWLLTSSCSEGPQVAPSLARACSALGAPRGQAVCGQEGVLAASVHVQ